VRHLLTLSMGLFLLTAPALAAGATAPSVAAPPVSPDPVDRIVVFKGAREMQLLRGGWIVKTYRIALGARPKGHKRWEFDGRTPEGVYAISGRNSHSRYYLALLISYPDDKDRAEAARLGVTPGGDIEIHGMPNPPHRPVRGDWTDGCIAVSNAAMREIWSLVRDGTSIEILP
jgi:murein L,D-transpeptidase YafK